MNCDYEFRFNFMLVGRGKSVSDAMCSKLVSPVNDSDFIILEYEILFTSYHWLNVSQLRLQAIEIY